MTTARNVTLRGNLSTLCAALELAAEKYDQNARECRGANFGRLADQFERQAREAREMLEQAYDQRDA